MGEGRENEEVQTVRVDYSFKIHDFVLMKGKGSVWKGTWCQNRQTDDYKGSDKWMDE